MEVNVDDFISALIDSLTNQFQAKGRAPSVMVCLLEGGSLFQIPIRDKEILNDARIESIRRLCRTLKTVAIGHFFVSHVGNPADVERWENGEREEGDECPDHRVTLCLEIESSEVHVTYVWPVIRRSRCTIVSLGGAEIHTGTIATWPKRQCVLYGVDHAMECSQCDNRSIREDIDVVLDAIFGRPTRQIL